jgi:hypothetical protein
MNLGCIVAREEPVVPLVPHVSNMLESLTENEHYCRIEDYFRNLEFQILEPEKSSTG